MHREGTQESGVLPDLPESRSKAAEAMNQAGRRKTRAGRLPDHPTGSDRPEGAIVDAAESNPGGLHSATGSPRPPSAIRSGRPRLIWGAAVTGANAEAVGHVPRDLYTVRAGSRVEFTVVADSGDKKNAQALGQLVQLRRPGMGLVIIIDTELRAEAQIDDRMLTALNLLGYAV